MNYEKAIIENLKLKKDRKLVVWSNGLLGQYISENLDRLKIKVDYWVADFKVGDRKDCHYIQSIKEIVPNVNKYFIFVSVYAGHKEIAEELIDLGYTYNVDFVITDLTMFCQELDMVDSLLTYTRSGEKYPGIVRFGNEVGKEDDYRILILGNSSSDASVGARISWPQFFYDELCKNTDKNFVVYDGAIGGYTSGQEFLKLSRDGIEINPDLVISFSGVNDIGDNYGSIVPNTVYLNKFQRRMWESILSTPNAVPDSLYMRNLKKVSHGVQTRKNSSELWLNNERKMHALCDEFNIKFVCFLQPMFGGGELPDEQLTSLLEDSGMSLLDFKMAISKFVAEVRDLLNGRNIEYIYDLTKIFDSGSKVFADNAHYSEKGNRIIAKYLSKKIMEII